MLMLIIVIYQPFIQLDKSSHELLVATPQTSTSRIRFIKGDLIFDDGLTVLGVNGNRVETYQKQEGTGVWISEQVDTTSTENIFTRISIDNKQDSGAWPFDCEKLIPCKNLPMQTCGCDYHTRDETEEKRGIVYNMNSCSEMAKKIDFQSCEELKFHGVSISGYFMINGKKTYCNSWSKYL